MRTLGSFKYRDGLFLVFVVVSCFGILELLLRTFVFDPSAAYIRTPGWAMQVRDNGLLPNVSEEYLYMANKLGIRGDVTKFSANPKIAVIGGSTVEDWVLPESKTWSQQLAVQLADCEPDIWVANLGKGGVNARHHLIQLPEVEKYMPHFDKFVVLLGLNDFLYDLHIHHPTVTPENWWRRQAFMYDRYDEGWFASVVISKRLFRRFVAEKNLERPVSDFGNYQKSLRDAYSRVASDQWVDALPDLTEHLINFRKTILALNAYSVSYGAQMVFVTQPYVWSDNLSNETRAQIYAGFIGADMSSPTTKWYKTSALEKGLAAYNAMLLDTCREYGLSCVDAAQILSGHPGFFYDDFHFSSLGAASIGRVVAAELRRGLGRCKKSLENLP